MKKLKFIIPALITVIILGILFSRIDFHEVVEVFSDSNKALLALSIIILFAVHPLGAARWGTVLSLLKYNGSFRNIFMLYLASIPISKITPSDSGDFIKAYYLKDKVPPVAHAGGILMEMLMEALVLAAMAMTMGFVLGFYGISFLGFAILVLIAGFFIIIPRLKIKFFERWQDKIESFFDVFKNSLKRPKLLFLMLFYTIIMELAIMIYVKLAFLAFGSDVSFIHILAIQPIVIFISTLPITIWGTGTRESAMIFLFLGLASPSAILAVGLTQSFVGAVMLPVLFLPLTYKTIKKVSQKKKNE